MRLRVGAYGLIHHESGIILVRVNEPDISAHGKWTLPGGGIEEGEDPRVAAKREILEETGLTVEIQSLVEIDSEVTEYRGEPLHTIRIVYGARILGGEMAAEQNGTTDSCQAFTVEALSAVDCTSLARRFAQEAT